MPVIDFDPQHKTEKLTDFPRLKLEAGEKARILCIEEQPTYAYVHTLRAPRIIDGMAQKKQVDRKDGSTYEDYVKDFIGRPLCLGGLGTLADKGVDPKNCPVCARSVETSEVDAPQRRFAMHVIKYAVKPNSWDLRGPFSCELEIWSFTDQIFNKLTDIKAQWQSLRKHDLLLGPCTNKDFQKFEIMVAPDAAWMLDERIKSTVVDTYRENKVADLEVFCGRRVERRWMEDDLDKIAQRWRIANGTPEYDATQAAERPTLSEGLSGLFDAAPASAAAAPVAASGLGELGDLFATAASSAPVATPAAPAPAAAANGGGLDFSDLLGAGSPPAATPASTQPAIATPAAAATPTAPAVDFDELLNSLS